MATGYEDLIPVSGYEDLIPKPTFGGMLQDELLRPFRAARDVVAGGVRGAGSVGVSLIRPFESGEENTARRIAMDAALKSNLQLKLLGPLVLVAYLRGQ